MNRSRTSTLLPRWLQDAVTGIGWWLLVLAVVAGIGLFNLPGDSQSRATARDVAAASTPVTVTDVQVHVTYEYAKGGGWYEVDQVRVHLPGAAAMTDLDTVANDQLPDRFTWHSGWQAPTGPTGYQAPLTVRVQYDGDGTPQRAVAQRDLDYWTIDNTDIESDVALAVLALVLAALSMTARAVWTRRARAKATSGWEPTASRAERRARAHRDDAGQWSAGKAGRPRPRR